MLGGFYLLRIMEKSDADSEGAIGKRSLSRMLAMILLRMRYHQD